MLWSRELRLSDNTFEASVTAIDLQQLYKTYPRRPAPALAGLSLTVEPHTLLALLGPSGSGKSTILKLIAGIERVDSGDIRLDGRSVLSVPTHRRGAVLMFQKAYLFPFLSVAENIAFGLRAQGVGRSTIQAEVARMLALVGLPGIEQRRPGQLSGGEQQRVALARALVTRPRVLLLDEPLSSLDLAVRQTLQSAVLQIQRELGITTILVTHDRAEALAMADRVALIDHGSLVAHDAPRRLYERPPTRRAARQMGVETFLYGEVRGNLLQSKLGPLGVHERPQSGAWATYAIRPEHVRLMPHPAPNTVAARVDARIYRGSWTEVALDAKGVKLQAHAPLPCVAAVGDHVYAQLPAEHLFPIEDDDLQERTA
jgi:ABC-type Fe3+/spermidine/putrescine transport system ATPase subunit